MKSKPFSVLMSIYKAEKPIFLRQSLDSLLSQTYPPQEIIIVEDGPLTSEIYKILEEYQHKNQIIQRIPLEKNYGLGYALNIGLRHCSYDLVARMDTDDICKPNRFEVQVKYMEDHPDVDVLGAWIDEFYETPENIVSIRKVPQHNDELYKFGKRRNPMNHPTVIFRKASVLKAGNYQTCMLLEDYFLWAKMLHSGFVFHNIQESLLFFRLSRDIYKRRGGFKYAKTEAKLQYHLYKIGYLKFENMIRNITNRFFVRILPVSLRRLIYRKLLR